ncbi:uncharacterized protein LOC110437272 [Sorghum bicolor]|uniref:uncharacterized protein LOC110437272 n=1 Tax=Sorghum bicolor TaxID=4558 RepID=UPI000B425DDD|nr:uncharacterized protein LOC110437272 [Sorghum bicolor]|eukprot:XP_021321334.1 uncharacterized protein LOC110437272 [Sorghum bicolor]
MASPRPSPPAHRALARSGPGPPWTGGPRPSPRSTMDRPAPSRHVAAAPAQPPPFPPHRTRIARVGRGPSRAPAAGLLHPSAHACGPACQPAPKPLTARPHSSARRGLVPNLPPDSDGRARRRPARSCLARAPRLAVAYKNPRLHPAPPLEALAAPLPCPKSRCHQNRARCRVKVPAAVDPIGRRVPDDANRPRSSARR